MQKRTPLKRQSFAACAALTLLIAGTPQLFGAATPIALRLEGPGTCVFNGSTAQTLRQAFGSSLASLVFAGTTSYEFYSPPLATPTTLTTSDKGSGVIFMRNTASASANDFSVAGRMQFF